MLLKKHNNTELWGKFQKGNDDALRIIYNENFYPLYNYGKKFTSDFHIIKDTIQELFIDLIQNRNKIKIKSDINFYLLKALRYKIIRTIKANNRKESLNNTFNDIEISTPDFFKDNDPQIELNLNEILKTLSNQQKEIVYLKFFNGLSNAEISEILDIKNQTVRNVLTSSLKKLRKILS